MAYRKPSWRKLKPSEVLPLWTPAHTSIAQLGFQAVMQKLQITDIKSYYTKLWPLIIFSMILCAAVGAADFEFKGLAIGAILGFAAPAALILLGVTLVVVVIYLAIYCFVWAVILCVAWWLLHS